MTVSDLKDSVIKAGFDFARRLADAKFRNWLKANGWRNEEHIVTTVDTEPVLDVLAKVTLHSGKRAFIAIAAASEPHGFHLLIVEPAPPRKRDLILGRAGDATPIAPSTNIGMIYDALEPVRTYVPSDWSQPIRFERVAVAA